MTAPTMPYSCCICGDAMTEFRQCEGCDRPMCHKHGMTIGEAPDSRLWQGMDDTTACTDCLPSAYTLKRLIEGYYNHALGEIERLSAQWRTNRAEKGSQ